MLELLCNSLPDATTTLGQDATDAADSVILDAMIKYPLSVNNNKELPDKTAKDQEKLTTSELPDKTESKQAQLPNTDSQEGNVHASTENSSMSGVSTVDNRNDNDISNVDTDNNVSHNLLENSIPHESTNEKSDASKLKDCITKLTDLSAEERNKWLGLSEKGSSPNASMDSNKSRYYMRKHEDPPRNNTKPG